VDEVNFLALAAGARVDPWRPHAITLNWGGHAERAFDVLSNPPGIGWWLAPVLHAPAPVQHLWILPWLVLCTWGAHALGRRFGGDGLAGVLLLCTAPLTVLAAQSLTPDLPLLALTAAGLGGFLPAVDEGRPRAAAGWALLAGSAVLFRYSGLCIPPLLLLYALLRRKAPWPALCGFLPVALLLLHDLHAYGQLHLLAMGGFQSTAGSGRELFRKLAAALAALGGAGLAPLLCLAGGRATRLRAVAGALVGLGAAVISGLDPAAGAWTVACCAAGAALLAAPFEPGGTRAERFFLGAWALGGLVFLLGLRFAAARYWLPFLPAPALAWLRLKPARGLVAAAAGMQIALALGLAVDEQAQARAQHEAAQDAIRAAGALPGERRFAGHWGWQQALEAAGWRALEDEQRLAPGALLAVAATPWPQQPADGTCLEPLWAQTYPDRWPGPRAHSAAGRANLHAYLVAGTPPLETYAPWTLADDPRERAALYRVCD